jgi:hypothetical protein
MTKGTRADPMRQDADLIETGVQMQSQGLSLLLAEMQALAGMMPGAFAPATGKTLAEAEAETEAGFDNMPV